MRIAYVDVGDDHSMTPTRIGEFCMVYVDGYNLMGKPTRADLPAEVIYEFGTITWDAPYGKAIWEDHKIHMLDGLLRTFRAKPNGILNMIDLWMSASNAQSCREAGTGDREYEVE